MVLGAIFRKHKWSETVFFSDHLPDVFGAKEKNNNEKGNAVRV